MPNIQWFLRTRNSTMGFVVQFAEPPFIRMVEFHCVKIYHDKSLPLVQIFTLKISNISKIKAIKKQPRFEREPARTFCKGERSRRQISGGSALTGKTPIKTINKWRLAWQKPMRALLPSSFFWKSL